jgi:hypothetical protein
MYGIHPETVRALAVSEAAEQRRVAGRKRRRRVPSASPRARHWAATLLVR